jgi:uncharacterized protein YndB with AHSA1/START domain
MTFRSDANDAALVVSRMIHRDATTLFEMWTTPAHLVRWWGPQGVTCIAAEVDLRAGGRYRIGNRLPGGRSVWITGEFEHIDAPRLLVYTWRIEADERTNDERVTVRFDGVDGGTRVRVLHERITDPTARESHARGWDGCLDGLAGYAEASNERQATRSRARSR